MRRRDAGQGANSKIVKTTPFGPVGIIWTAANRRPRVIRIHLSRPGSRADDKMAALYPGSRKATCPEIDGLAAAIGGFLRGEDIVFPLDLVDLTLCGEFQQRVLRAEHRIPRGRVSTYRLIATHLGKDKAARAVGSALAGNPFPIIVPCHRAIRSDRRLGGYQGGLAMKKCLLEREGIRFDGAGRVICEQYYYDSR